MLSQLNTQQRRAAESINGPILVLAGAGTGKTRVMTERIAHMIHRGIPAEKIVGVSFTKKASREMKERMTPLVGEAVTKKIELSTFHSLALKILRQYGSAVGLPNHFSILEESDSYYILRETLKENGLTDIISLPMAKEKLSQAKDRLLSPDDLRKRDSVVDRTMIAKLLEGYQARLKLYNAVDFDDLIYLSTRMLQTVPTILDKLHKKYSYFLVDEFQDTSFSQLSLIQLLAQKERNICVVGDDDQSIYSWRGANPETMQNFFQLYPEAQKITLSQNYRCTQLIVNAANSVISKNTGRLGKELWSDKSSRKNIAFFVCDTERDEANALANLLLKEKRTHQRPYSDFAILVRSNKQTLPFEQALLERKIPYDITGGQDLFERKEIKDLLSYIKLYLNPQDLHALSRIANIPNRGIGLKSFENLKELLSTYQFSVAFEEGIGLNFGCPWEGLPKRFAPLHNSLKKLAEKHRGIQSLYDSLPLLMKKLQQCESTGEVASQLNSLLNAEAFQTTIALNSSSVRAQLKKGEVARRFIKVIENLDVQPFSLQSLGDTLFINKSFQEGVKEKKEAVQILTMHASKGLEYPVVFLVGLEDGILPHEKSLDSQTGIEEERRLFYVAITRAKETLHMSHVRRRNAGKHVNQQSASRFLNEIPAGLFQESTLDIETEEEKRRKAARKLFELIR